MKKFVITTALAVVLAGGAYAQGHHGPGGGPGGGGGGGSSISHGGGPGGGGGPSMMSHGGGPGGGGPSGGFSSPRGPGPSAMGPTRGPSGLYNRSQTMREGNARFTEGREGRNRFTEGREGGQRFTEGNQHRYFNRYEGREGRFEGREGRVNPEFRHGIARGDFFEHGRHFHFRRFWHGEWVFLTDWDDCTAWAWVHVAPGVWAWTPIDVCIG